MLGQPELEVSAWQELKFVVDVLEIKYYRCTQKTFE